MAHVTLLPYTGEIEITDNPARGPYFYGGAVTAWIKYWLGIDARYTRRHVDEKRTLLVS